MTGIVRPLLTRHDVAQHPVLKDLDVLHFPQATNYRVTPQQWEIAMALLSSQPRPPFDAALVQEEAELRGLVLNVEIYASVIAALQAGKHIVLTGPPGTAKTTLAEAVAAAAERAGLCAGYVLSTATSDWTTFETVGGLRPRADGTLEFAPGQFVKAIQDDRWLIVDELNRSNFDRAFGQLFTLLSGQSVSLPYEDADSDLPICLALEGTPAVRDRTSSVIVLRKSWRLLATMNVFDKSLLFEMSFALMRRFAFIEVSAPDNDVYRKIVASELESADADQAARIQALLETFLALRNIKELGPALFLDMARFARERLNIGDIGDPQLVYQLFYSYLLPQFEGIDDATGEQLLSRLSPSVERSMRGKLSDDLKNVLGVELRPPRPVDAPSANEALDDNDVDVDDETPRVVVDGSAE